MTRKTASSKHRPKQSLFTEKPTRAPLRSSPRRSAQLSQIPRAPTHPGWPLPDLPLDIKFLIADHLDIATAKSAALSCRALQDLGEYRIWREVQCDWPDKIKVNKKGVKIPRDKDDYVRLARIHETRLGALKRRPVRGLAIKAVHLVVGQDILASQLGTVRRIVQLARLRLNSIRLTWVGPMSVQDRHTIADFIRTIVANTVYANVHSLTLPQRWVDGYSFSSMLYVLRCFPSLPRIDASRPRDLEHNKRSHFNSVSLPPLRTQPVFAEQLDRTDDLTYDRFPQASDIALDTVLSER